MYKYVSKLPKLSVVENKYAILPGTLIRKYYHMSLQEEFWRFF